MNPCKAQGKRPPLLPLVPLVLVLAACGQPAQHDPGADLPDVETTMVTVSTPHAAQGSLAPAGVPTDPVTGLSGVNHAVLTVWRDGERVLINADLEQTTDPDLDRPVELNGDNGFTAELRLRYGTFEFRIEARDSAKVPIATGSRTVELPVEDALSIELVSLVGWVQLIPDPHPRSGLPVDVMVLVAPYEGSGLRVPPSDYDRRSLIDGALALGVGSRSSDLGYRIIPRDCGEVRVQVSVTSRASPPGPTVTATIRFDSFCPAAAHSTRVAS